MKKGLITALGTIALAIAGNGFALAPVISDVPDVIIGDAEDNVGQSVDMNFFRLNNALNLMTYVNPTDSTDPGELIFAFDETGTGDTLDISGATGNPITQLTDSTAAPSLWPADKRITNAVSGSFMLSFRNIALSPRPTTGSDGGPFAEPAQAEYSREVTLFMGDEADNVDTDVINVYTKDDQNDALSGTLNYTPIFSQSAFPGTDIYGWAFTQFAFTMYSPCTSSTGTAPNTYLGITSGATASVGGSFFERWWQPGAPAYNSPIPHIDGNIVYCAKMRLTLEGVTNSLKSYAPDIRFGVENTGQNLVTTNLLFSQSFAAAGTPDDRNPQLPDLGVARDYKFFWAPNASAPDVALVANYAGIDWRRWRMFFDITDANEAAAGVPQDAGTWKISFVEVGYINRPGDVAPVAGSSTNFRLTDLTSAARSDAGGDFAADVNYTKNGSVQQNVPAAGKITFNINAATTATSVLWQRLNTAPWSNGKVLRVTARLSCPTAADRTNFALGRVRHQGVLPWVAQVFTVRREPGLAGVAAGAAPYVPALASAAPNGTPYECYVASYGGPNAWINSLNGQIGALNPAYFILGLDHVQNGADAAMQWTVHEVLYETFDEAAMMP